MTIKIILAAGAVLIVVLTAVLFVVNPAPTGGLTTPAATSTETELYETPTTTATTSVATTPLPGKLKVANFSGKLEAVHMGCFSDGECYVVVDGKHVTVLRGWSQETVGSIQGALSIGDLEGMIGSTIEVYAKDDSDGTYTLYGSEGFYVKVTEAVKSEPATPAPISSGSCVVGGCSSQLCLDASEGDMASTCEYREVYACYKTATCERQSSGQCGWTPTPTLTACVAASS